MLSPSAKKLMVVKYSNSTQPCATLIRQSLDLKSKSLSKAKEDHAVPSISLIIVVT